MKSIIVLPYLFLLGCNAQSVEVISDPSKIKNLSSATKPITPNPMGNRKTKFEVELEQQQNKIILGSQQNDSYNYSISYLRDERDKLEEERRKKKKEESEASDRKIKSLNDEYNSLKVMHDYKDLSNDERQNIKNRMEEINIYRNSEWLYRAGNGSKNSRSWEWEWSR